MRPSSIDRAYCASGVGEGWYGLVAACEATLNGLVGEDNWEPAQVKEKFGGLRFYYDPDTATTGMEKRAKRIIDDLEEVSFHVCELTGKPGKAKRNGRGWIKTLSDEARESFRESERSISPPTSIPEIYNRQFKAEWIPLVWACHGVLDGLLGDSWTPVSVDDSGEELLFLYEDDDSDAARKASGLITSIESASFYL